MLDQTNLKQRWTSEGAEQNKKITDSFLVNIDTQSKGHPQGKHVVYSKAPDQADSRFNRSKCPFKGFLETPFQSQSFTKTLSPSPPDPRSHTNQPQPPLDFNAMITIFGPVAKICLWSSSLVVTSQKRAAVTQEAAEATDKHARWDEQAQGRFP